MAEDTGTGRINYVLGVSSLYEKLPADFKNGFLTVEQKFFDGYIPVKKDTVFHWHIPLVHDDFFKMLEDHDAFKLIDKYRVRRFSFDIGPCYKDFKTIDNKYVGTARRLNAKDVSGLCGEKISRLRKRLPAFCEVAVESLNYYGNGSYEDVTEPEFYRSICKDYGVGLVLDMAHAEVSAYNKKVDYRKYLGRFEFGDVRELHVSRIGIPDGGEAIDFHDEPDEPEFETLYETARKTKGSIDTVIEYWKDVPGIMRAYRRMGDFLKRKAINTRTEVRDGSFPQR